MMAWVARADTLPDGTDLREVDLSGATFEHVYVSHDLRGANLAKTVWRSMLAWVAACRLARARRRPSAEGARPAERGPVARARRWPSAEGV
ncbi:MAG: hypothetical protein KF901_13040 [Myxococcales bacterium]|nr:hypothetical protein [Myxococcales bacterium]